MFSYHTFLSDHHLVYEEMLLKKKKDMTSYGAKRWNTHTHTYTCTFLNNLETAKNNGGLLHFQNNDQEKQMGFMLFLWVYDMYASTHCWSVCSWSFASSHKLFSQRYLSALTPFWFPTEMYKHVGPLSWNALALKN